MPSFPSNIAITAIDLVYAAVAGEKTSRDNLPVALAGYAAADNAITTAVEGVALSQSIVDMLLTNLINHSTYGGLFDGSATSSMIKNIIIGEIENQVSDELMIKVGFEVNATNRAALAQEAYEMACIYKDELKASGDSDNANRLAVLEGIRFTAEKPASVPLIYQVIK